MRSREGKWPSLHGAELRCSASRPPRASTLLCWFARGRNQETDERKEEQRTSRCNKGPNQQRERETDKQQGKSKSENAAARRGYSKLLLTQANKHQ
jgi:hypothetical protein